MLDRNLGQLKNGIDMTAEQLKTNYNEMKFIRERTLNRKSYGDLLSKVPLKNKKKATRLLDLLLCTLRVNLTDLVIEISNKQRHLLVINNTAYAIDLFYSKDEFFCTNSGNVDFNVETITDDIFDLWNQLKEVLPSHDANLSYKSLNQIVEIKKGKLYVGWEFIDNISNVEFYNTNQYIDAGNLRIIWNRGVLQQLFSLPDEDIEPINIDCSITLKCNCTCNCKYLSIYPVGTFDKTSALSSDGRVLRELYIGEQNLPEDGKQKYVFETLNWSDLDIRFKNCSNRSITKASYSQQSSLPLIFLGQFQFDNNESQKERLLVWKLVNTKICIPISELPFDTGEYYYLLLPKDSYENKQQTNLDVLRQLNVNNESTIKHHVTEKGIYFYTEIPAYYEDAIRKLVDMGYGEYIKDSVDEEYVFLIDNNKG